MLLHRNNGIAKGFHRYAVDGADGLDAKVFQRFRRDAEGNIGFWAEVGYKKEALLAI